jgi:DNA repair photolyase
VKARPSENPPVRFRDVTVTYEGGVEGEGAFAPPPTTITLLEDQSRSILSHNTSDDLDFRWSCNPYRGCQHACAYCYARPNHEYLDMGAGTDFDTKIVFKPRAADLLREAFDKPSWTGELVMFSGVTDCYQAVEAELGLTRQCLEVCLEYKNPVAIITKSALIERDIDLLAALAREAGCSVSVSLAWTDAEMARTIEPWAASPQRRLRVLERLAKAGVPVGVMIAPVIPGLNDSQMVGLLEAAKSAGAQWAGWTLLRLPGAVKEVFEGRLRVSLPLVADRVMNRVRETRGGKLYDSTFGVRGRGIGVYAQTIGTMFDTTVKRLGLDEGRQYATPNRFQRPAKKTAQLSLF